ncbi:M20/M25/M40 family metallo-hydrolase [Marinivivus vitaminiproducens]|uniref:M20/M25/M40 family metallo-hydrolase n=1 Tax=Marinivivus vitaminiproducens TaxID=3035935 RepID=UPI00279F0D2F|nr:M20/M25/M40 family metallo-hydrolase [Geminicoccaceae bacterium SCSIO 64248]
MDPRTLPCDTDAVLARLEPWIECESPTFDRAAVNRMMDLAASDLRGLGAEVTRLEGSGGFGDCVLGRFPHPKGDAGGILVMGHLDTVHPVGTLADLPFRRDGGRCYGPGILDMKGGCRLALEAIAALREAGLATELPVSVLFTSDEEVGSPSTRALIEAEAGRHRFILVPEPARGAFGVVTGRYAIARFNLEAVGQPSHAGLGLRDRRSAIRAMAQKLLAIEDMTTDACTFSVGVIHGGRWVNCVPTVCVAEALSMAKRQDDLDTGTERILALSSSENGVDFRVARGVVRPVWEPDAGTLGLYGQASAIAAQLGHDLPHGSLGGGSDGNFTGALGIPTLDGLGLAGEGVHTLDEHITVDSLAPRMRLVAGLLATLSA